MGIGGKPRQQQQQQQQQHQDDFDAYTGYRVMYHVEKFVAGWRNLVLFYLAMFIAGYAQVVDSFLFWGAVAALLLVYWEPYLSPPFPWSFGGNPEDELTPQTAQKWGSRPSWMHPARRDERQAVRQWLYCLRRSLPQKQQAVHRLMQGCIVLPCVSMGVGVVQQNLYFPLDDVKAMYYSAILFAIMLVYTLSTVGVNFIILWLAKCKLQPASVAEAWQPQDMMYFMCKILGEFLNTVVQTLVAGAFVTYMPNTIFWLGAVITGMSYTATNLLFDMGPGTPVQDDKVDSHWVTDCTCCSSSSSGTATTPSCGKDVQLESAADLAGGGDQRRHERRSGVNQAAGAGYGTAAVTDNDDVALSLDGAEAAENFTGNKSARANSHARGCEVRSDNLKRSAVDDSPPFLMYKWPKGIRGWSIIALLMGQAVPCVAILVLLGIGKHNNMPELYLVNADGACPDSCLKRYEQLLYALACLGLLTCYYAFTIGFLGCGPVTFVYRYVYRGCFKPAEIRK